MSQLIRCTLCAEEHSVPLEHLVAHMEARHAAALETVARWPDGSPVVLNEDLEELTG